MIIISLRLENDANDRLQYQFSPYFLTYLPSLLCDMAEPCALQLSDLVCRWLTWCVDVNGLFRGLDQIYVCADGRVGGEERRHCARVDAVSRLEASVVSLRLMVVAVVASRCTVEQCSKDQGEHQSTYWHLVPWQVYQLSR